MYTLASRLSKVDADQLAEIIATEFELGTAHPAVKKVRRLAELGPDEESDLFELEELKSLSMVLQTHAFIQHRLEGYAGLRAEITRVLFTGS